MHALGWAHGDLHLENIGYKNNDPYDVVFLDTDTMYKIEGAEEQGWLKRWMEEGFDWEDEVDDFVKYDFSNWNNDWIFVKK